MIMRIMCMQRNVPAPPMTLANPLPPNSTSEIYPQKLFLTFSPCFAKGCILRLLGSKNLSFSFRNNIQENQLKVA